MTSVNGSISLKQFNIPSDLRKRKCLCTKWSSFCFSIYFVIESSTQKILCYMKLMVVNVRYMVILIYVCVQTPFPSCSVYMQARCFVFQITHRYLKYLIWPFQTYHCPITWSKLNCAFINLVKIFVHLLEDKFLLN